MKNHRIVNGQLLQTNKKFSHLNQDQKNRIAEWIYEEYRSICGTHGRVPNKEDDVQIVSSVMARITDKKYGFLRVRSQRIIEAKNIICMSVG